MTDRFGQSFFFSGVPAGPSSAGTPKKFALQRERRRADFSCSLAKPSRASMPPNDPGDDRRGTEVRRVATLRVVDRVFIKQFLSRGLLERPAGYPAGEWIPNNGTNSRQSDNVEYEVTKDEIRMTNQ
jgi:hypothetical protein